jgi:hypothetical protein
MDNSLTRAVRRGSSGVLRGLHAQIRNAIVGVGFPVRVPLRHPGVNEQQPRVVPLLLRNLGEIDEQGSGKGIPSEDVHAAPENKHGNVVGIVEETRDWWPDCLLLCRRGRPLFLPARSKR